MASRDRAFCQSVINGEDVHSHWLGELLAMYPEYLERLAWKTNQTDETKIRKGGRDIIKADFVFASFYGSTARSCAKKTDVPEEVMVPLSGEFWRVYKGVKKWQDIQRNTYKSEASIYTITGRERHGPLEGGNEVINNPIQGSAADIVADAMNELAALSREMDDPYFHPRMQIHDDLTFILKDDNYLEDYLMEIFRVMVKVRYPWQIVPFAVEASIGENWADTMPLHTHVGDYVR